MFDIVLYPFFYWLKILVVVEGRLQIQLEDVKFQEDFVIDESKYSREFELIAVLNSFFNVLLLVGNNTDDIVFANSAIAAFRLSGSNNVLMTTIST